MIEIKEEEEDISEMAASWALIFTVGTKKRRMNLC